MNVISFHCTDDYHFTIAPLLWLWSKIFNKKICYHFFGGDFHIKYQKLPIFWKWILIKTILNSDTVFFETKELIQFFKAENIKNMVWLPNSRQPPLKKISNKIYAKRFVFISRIVPQKGIGELMEAALKLDNTYKVAAYGPIDDRHYTSQIFEETAIQYGGILKPEEVQPTLQKYDVLVLPTYFYGEGYPGIIIEALSLGMPIITTEWMALPEIVEHKRNGLLVPIKNPEILKDAILYFNEENYIEMQKNAFESFKQFNSEIVFNKIVESFLNEKNTRETEYK